MRLPCDAWKRTAICLNMSCTKATMSLADSRLAVKLVRRCHDARCLLVAHAFVCEGGAAGSHRLGLLEAACPHRCNVLHEEVQGLAAEHRGEVEMREVLKPAQRGLH